MLETLQARLRNVAIHQSTSLKRISILFLYLALFIAFFAVKWTYPIIDAAVAFPDTRSYAITAEQPVTSLSFWAGIRPITVPMFYKLLDVNAENYQQSEKLKLIAETQIWISMVCWTVLGLSISRKMCSRILAHCLKNNLTLE
jgi:hypothetical protein